MISVLGLLDDREVPEAEEVELHEADLLDALHVELRHDLVLGGLEERHVFGERLLGDDDAGGVLGRVAHLALEVQGDLHELRHARVLLRQLP